MPLNTSIFMPKQREMILILIGSKTNFILLTEQCEPRKFLGENGDKCQNCPIGAKPIL